MKPTELSSIMYQDHQQVAKQWIHWFPGIYSNLDETRPFPYTMNRWRDCYTIVGISTMSIIWPTIRYLLPYPSRFQRLLHPPWCWRRRVDKSTENSPSSFLKPPSSCWSLKIWFCLLKSSILRATLHTYQEYELHTWCTIHDVQLKVCTIWNTVYG